MSIDHRSLRRRRTATPRGALLLEAAHSFCRLVLRRADLLRFSPSVHERYYVPERKLGGLTRLGHDLHYSSAPRLLETQWRMPAARGREPGSY